MHIASTQVQRPGDVVEGCHQHPVGMFLPQGLTDTGDFVMSRFTSIFQRMNHHRMIGNNRTILPDQLQRIEVGAEGETTLTTQIGNQCLHLVGRRAPSVDTHLCTSTTLTSYPFCNGGCTRYLQFHQLILGAFQLLLSRQEIAGVGPQGGGVHRDHCRSCRTVETADTLAALPMVGHVFTLMGVGTGEDKCCEMFTLHHFTEIG